MAVDVTGDEYAGVMYCTTSMFAFGPVFDSKDDAQAFIEWCDVDPRTLSDADLSKYRGEWETERELEP